MSYHPIMGILIFLISIILAFFMGRKIIKKKIFKNSASNTPYIKSKSLPPKGEITSPDAPWLKEK